MNMKYYLRGLGTGILLATIILCISFAIRTNDANIINQAKELGMVFPDEKSSSNNEKNTSEGSTTNNGSENNNTTETSSSEQTTTENEKGNDETENSTDEKVTENDTTTEEPSTKKEEESTTGEEPENGKLITFTIERGMSSGKVAKLLQSLGIIEDAADFDNYICSNGYAAKIRLGTYSIKVGESYKNIAKIICGK